MSKNVTFLYVTTFYDMTRHELLQKKEEEFSANYKRKIMRAVDFLAIITTDYLQIQEDEKRQALKQLQ